MELYRAIVKLDQDGKPEEIQVFYILPLTINPLNESERLKVS